MLKCTIIQQPTFHSFFQRKLWLPVLPPCPCSACVTTGVSRHRHSGGERCIYVSIQCTAAVGGLCVAVLLLLQQQQCCFLLLLFITVCVLDKFGVRSLSLIRGLYFSSFKRDLFVTYYCDVFTVSICLERPWKSWTCAEPRRADARCTEASLVLYLNQYRTFTYRN